MSNARSNSPALPLLSNRAARRLFLDLHALGGAPTGPAKGRDLTALITRLGFVQIDSVNTVERAHHMILHARRQSYRPQNLKPLLEQDRALFEHWTHDASAIPMAFFPHWRLFFERDADGIKKRWKNWHDNGFESKFQDIAQHINDHGPVGSGDVGHDEPKSNGGWWNWHPSKTALEYMWRSGQLSVTRRDGFKKIYDLTQRVVPDCHLTERPQKKQTIDWACDQALARLGFATSGEIAAFWGKITAAEARQWCQTGLASGHLIEIEVESADGSKPRRSYARPDVFTAAKAAQKATSGIRVLSPFDPALRDRARAQRLFNFFYRIEIFVPAPKRKYGYYVFPLLEGDTIIGRIDMKRQGKAGVLHVTGFWPEPGLRLTDARLDRLRTGLQRTAKFSGCETITYDPDWIKNPVH